MINHFGKIYTIGKELEKATINQNTQTTSIHFNIYSNAKSYKSLHHIEEHNASVE